MVKSSKLIIELIGRLRPVMNFGSIDSADTYTIGQLSAHLGVSLRTLRFYEQSGLLAPNREGLRRLYSRDDLDRLQIIVTLRELEVSLTAIKSLMAAIDSEGRTSEREVMVRTDSVLADLAGDNLARIDELKRINDRIARARDNLALA